MAKTEHVTRVEHDGREIIIVGTAHISQRSVEEVKRVIDAERPDTVCVELDAMRYEALVDESRWSKLDVFQVIRQKKVLYLLTNIALSAYQRKMGARLGVRPGAELLAAVTKAEEVGAKLVLADRDVQATLKRAWSNLSFWTKMKIVSTLMAVPFAVEELTEETLEELKDRDTISEMLEEFAKQVPGVKEPLIDERDLYLISSITDAPGKKIVAVVGAGHVKGMVAHLGEPVDRAALSVIPAPSKVTALLKWIIPTLVLAAFYFGYRENAGRGLMDMLLAWVIPNSVVAGLFALVAGARLLTVLVAIVASPITSLNPTIGAGMVAGLVEAWLRKPTVEECQRVTEDVLTLRGIYRNGFTRVLIVVVATTLGSAVGAWIGASWVVWLLR